MTRCLLSPACRIRIVSGCLGLLIASLAIVVSSVDRGAAATIGELGAQPGRQQAREQSLASAVARLSGSISALDNQIALVEQREAAVRADLVREREELARVRLQLGRERRIVALLKARLAAARQILARQLVSGYKNAKPTLISVVLDAHGFTDLLEEFDFLHRAEQQQQSVIVVTRRAKAAADSAERRLAALEASDAAITRAPAARERAIASMNALLQSRQTAMRRARAAQQEAPAASRARGRTLQDAIARLQAQQAATDAAATAPGPGAAPTATGLPLGSAGGWVVPPAIVQCESGGQNLSPNSAGASGYCQIIPETWKLSGGSGPAAWLAGKAEQDAVAARIWKGGAGASNWVCARMVGIG